MVLRRKLAMATTMYTTVQMELPQKTTKKSFTDREKTLRCVLYSLYCREYVLADKEPLGSYTYLISTLRMQRKKVSGNDRTIMDQARGALEDLCYERNPTDAAADTIFKTMVDNLSFAAVEALMVKEVRRYDTIYGLATDYSADFSNDTGVIVTELEL